VTDYDPTKSASGAAVSCARSPHGSLSLVGCVQAPIEPQRHIVPLLPPNCSTGAAGCVQLPQDRAQTEDVPITFTAFAASHHSIRSRRISRMEYATRERHELATPLDSWLRLTHSTASFALSLHCRHRPQHSVTGLLSANKFRWETLGISIPWPSRWGGSCGECNQLRGSSVADYDGDGTSLHAQSDPMGAAQMIPVGTAQ
jgi:hypothetical protein